MKTSLLHLVEETMLVRDSACGSDPHELTIHITAKRDAQKMSSLSFSS